MVLEEFQNYDTNWSPNPDQRTNLVIINNDNNKKQNKKKKRENLPYRGLSRPSRLQSENPGQKTKDSRN